MLVLGIVLLNLALAAPADDDYHKVQFLNYKNDDDLAEIQRQIIGTYHKLSSKYLCIVLCSWFSFLIAQFDQLGGTSQFHNVQSTSFVDPNNIQINV